MSTLPVSSVTFITDLWIFSCSSVSILSKCFLIWLFLDGIKGFATLYLFNFVCLKVILAVQNAHNNSVYVIASAVTMAKLNWSRGSSFTSRKLQALDSGVRKLTAPITPRVGRIIVSIIAKVRSDFPKISAFLSGFNLINRVTRRRRTIVHEWKTVKKMLT